MSYESLHWSIVNILFRLSGLMAGLASVAFGLTALMKATGGSFPTSPHSPLIDLIVAALSFLYSVGMLRISPYRPDVSKQYSGSAELSRPKLGWWTGAPKK